ncbi:hypothetical protein BOTBODRAFT_469242 [Botryobasidium botryosum FD-172 SS1]|uniref:Uncharacterized protein n=1 Tax=Botryobasidium botryosum (strain FD-172 SS1) TaxID=930990 RepID=A0A067M8D6_BOTB1|nr:hypothetical protein BOTBODRAFT_469242 [Botryobasidium botryosum FD-172 SS1]
MFASRAMRWSVLTITRQQRSITWNSWGRVALLLFLLPLSLLHQATAMAVVPLPAVVGAALLAAVDLAEGAVADMATVAAGVVVILTIALVAGTSAAVGRQEEPRRIEVRSGELAVDPRAVMLTAVMAMVLASLLATILQERPPKHGSLCLRCRALMVQGPSHPLLLSPQCLLSTSRSPRTLEAQILKPRALQTFGIFQIAARRLKRPKSRPGCPSREYEAYGNGGRTSSRAPLYSKIGASSP